MTEKEAIKYLEYMKKNIGFNRIGYVYGNEAIETVLNLIQTQQEEIEKKDKIINEMATALYDEWYMPSLNTVEKIKEYFIKEVEKEK